MALRRVSAVLSQQALFVGQITDAVTGGAPRATPAVALTYQTPPDRPYPLAARIEPGGRFAFAGDPLTALPRLTAGTLDLRLTVTAARYQPASVDFSLTPADLALVEETRDYSGHTVTVRLLNAPLLDQAVALDPEPLILAGRLVDADDGATPLDGASVSVIAPEARGPVVTDANGYFTLEDMPLAPEITVRAQRAGFQTLDQVVRLDYDRPLNERQFALAPTP